MAILNRIIDDSVDPIPTLPEIVPVDGDVEAIFAPFEMPKMKKRGDEPLIDKMLTFSPDGASAITFVITQISSQDPIKCCRVLCQLDRLVNDERRVMLVNNIDQMLILISLQLNQCLARLVDQNPSTEATVILLLRSSLSLITSVLRYEELAHAISKDTLKHLFKELVQLLVNDRIAALKEGDKLTRAFNSLLGQIICASEPTRIFSGVIRLLHECVACGLDSIMPAVMKSIWRITNNLGNRINEYDLNVILMDCHVFFKAFPSESWKSRKSDIPLRTMKSFLYAMCKLRGSYLLDYLESIPDKSESELEHYLIRSLDDLDKKGELDLELVKANAIYSKKCTNKSAHEKETLAGIFDKIIQRDWTSAMEELFDFKLQFPHVDITKQLERCPPSLKAIIPVVLKNINYERNASIIPAESSNQDALKEVQLNEVLPRLPDRKSRLPILSNHSPGNQNFVETSLKRLSYFNNKLGLPNEEFSLPVNGKISNGSKAKTTEPELPIEEPELYTVGQPNRKTLSGAQFDAYKQRLNKIKNQT
ncbi:Cytoskeleton associated protein 5 [Cichlidogyrus casuarinus]|uniref:Cytoskeleton associated protein 5 n=1 Tax=Cichlidogyrus casuarinus TaxID=1844966 RepID=A0ABD2PY43_9PLAT